MLISDTITVLVQVLGYSLGTPSAKEFANSINYPELGSGRQLVIGYAPFIVLQLLLIAVSYKFAMKHCIQACILLVLLRAQIEFLIVDILAPLEPKLGYNRVKLWVGTFGLGY